ncbi:MAG: helix-turn-helix domain-containing protein [Erysipelotrichaceae bacterium]
MEIGNKIKQLRQKNKLTLEELASRSELTKGFLSQLENELNTPSIATLENICEVFGVTMSEFFAEAKDQQIVFTQKDFFVDEREGSVVSWVVPHAQSNEMEPVLIKLKPGAKSMEVSPHEGEEFGYVLEGSITLVGDNTKEIIKKGQTFYLKGEENHYLINKSKQVAQFLWVCSPPLF